MTQSEYNQALINAFYEIQAEEEALERDAGFGGNEFLPAASWDVMEKYYLWDELEERVFDQWLPMDEERWQKEQGWAEPF
jgi:hypothetical protein